VHKNSLEKLFRILNVVFGWNNFNKFFQGKNRSFIISLINGVIQAFLSTYSNKTKDNVLSKKYIFGSILKFLVKLKIKFFKWHFT
jgi:hypothetical protein